MAVASPSLNQAAIDCELKLPIAADKVQVPRRLCSLVAAIFHDSAGKYSAADTRDFGLVRLALSEFLLALHRLAPAFDFHLLQVQAKTEVKRKRNFIIYTERQILQLYLTFIEKRNVQKRGRRFIQKPFFYIQNFIHKSIKNRFHSLNIKVKFFVNEEK